MKAADVVNQLALKLPQNTDAFTTNVGVSSLSASGGVATAVTATAHGLAVGKQVNVYGAKPPITISSLTRVGTVGTLVTATAHDITLGSVGSVELEGATEAEFNGTFTILSVPNRTTITFFMEDAGATTATGSPVLLNGASYLNSYNGLHEVLTVPDTTTFTYAVSTSIGSPASGTIEARMQPRVTGVVSEETIMAAYTRQDSPTDLWAYVVLGDVTANRSRLTDTDATADIQRGQYYRQQLIQPLTVYVVIPTADELAARDARDRCEGLLQPLTRSILFKQFDSYLSVATRAPLQFTGHGFAAYTRAFYIHAYEFEQIVDLTFDDTVGYDDDVAFRDIELSMAHDQGTGVTVMTASINLDEDGV